MQAHCQSTKFPGLGRSCDFNKLKLEGCIEEELLCKALRFRKAGLPLLDAAFRIATASPQAQNLDRDVIRSAALPSQIDQLAAR